MLYGSEGHAISRPKNNDWYKLAAPNHDGGVGKNVGQYKHSEIGGALFARLGPLAAEVVVDQNCHHGSPGVTKADLEKQIA